MGENPADNRHLEVLVQYISSVPCSRVEKKVRRELWVEGKMFFDIYKYIYISAILSSNAGEPLPAQALM